MIAFARKQPRPCRRLRKLDLLTVWTATERITGAYLGFHLDTGSAYVVILECVDCEPRRIDWREIRRAVRHQWCGKRHKGAEV